MSFVREARLHAARWKRHTPLLPAAAREDGPRREDPEGRRYAHLLPLAFREQNLLPAARGPGLKVFKRDRIPWQDGGDLPTNNLLSSQVQCVNALAPLLRDSLGVKRLFVPFLPIQEILPWKHDEALVFEWIGEADYLSEAQGRPRARGSRATSADAAIRYRTNGGAIETALIEWKYVEGTYDPELQGGVAARMHRYRKLFHSEDGPLREDLVPYEDLFVEPFYQLMRQQLLAAAIERAGEGVAETVRVVHVAPKGNEAFHGQLSRPSHRDAGATVLEVWQRLQRRRDRFVSVDSAELLARVPDRALQERYTHMLATGKGPPASQVSRGD